MCDIRGAISSTLIFVQSYAAVPVNVHIDEDVPQRVWLDELRIKQIIINGLSNACKITTEGRIDVVVSNGTGGQLRIEVSPLPAPLTLCYAQAFGCLVHSRPLPPPAPPLPPSRCVTLGQALAK